jgi:hypothetical protein
MLILYCSLYPILMFTKFSWLHFFLYWALGDKFVSDFRLHMSKLRYFDLGGEIFLRFSHNFELF